MADHAPVCAITGTSGYLGSRLKRHLERLGWTVVELGRKPGQVPWTLGAAVPPEEFSSRGVAALVHCAYDFSSTRGEDVTRVNVDGTRRLFEAARSGGVGRIVLISSMSAYADCRSVYGRAELEAEPIASEFGTVILRPGLIYGDQPGGMVGAMAAVMKRSPIVPLIGSGHSVLYLTHEDDLVRLIQESVIGSDSVPVVVPVTAASELGLEFREILRILARKTGKRPRFLPIPWWLVWGVFRFAEMLGLRLRLRSDGVVGLVFADPHPDFSRTRLLGIPFRSFAESFRPVQISS